MANLIDDHSCILKGNEATIGCVVERKGLGTNCGEQAAAICRSYSTMSLAMAALVQGIPPQNFCCTDADISKSAETVEPGISINCAMLGQRIVHLVGGGHPTMPFGICPSSGRSKTLGNAIYRGVNV